MPARRPFPWYYGSTIGPVYGRNKRLVMAVLAGKEDPRWLGFLELALSGNPIPERLSSYIVTFRGTEAQKETLSELIEQAREYWLARTYEALD